MSMASGGLAGAASECAMGAGTIPARRRTLSPVRPRITETSNVAELKAEPETRSSGAATGANAWQAISSTKRAATARRAVPARVRPNSMMGTLTQARRIANVLNEAARPSPLVGN